MIALEIQGLSERRENLLMEIGRTVFASGFTLQRQRLVQDDHGVLLTMVVRGPARQQRALSDALDAHQRLTSFVIDVFDEAVQRPHFAASLKQDWKTAVAELPMIVVPPADVNVVPEKVSDELEPFIELVRSRESETEIELEDEAIFASISVPVRTAKAIAVPMDSFVELIPIGADVSVVDKLQQKLTSAYPDIFPVLQALQQSVVEAARASSLLLAGQRTGAWLFERDYNPGIRLNLKDAIESVAVPALRTLVEVEQRGEQLHILNSPICVEGGHSSCQFFNGYLESLLGPAMSPDTVSIFSVCCRSFGAGECVFALSDAN